MQLDDGLGYQDLGTRVVRRAMPGWEHWPDPECGDLTIRRALRDLSVALRCAVLGHRVHVWRAMAGMTPDARCEWCGRSYRERVTVLEQA
jgi:hypothetical protein